MNKFILLVLAFFLLLFWSVLASPAPNIQDNSQNSGQVTKDEPKHNNPTPAPAPPVDDKAAQDKAAQDKAAQDKADASTADDQSVLPVFYGK